MKARGQLKIAQKVTPKGKTSWVLSGTKLDGTRIRDCYNTEAEALMTKQALENEAANVVSAPKGIVTHVLNEAQLRDAERATLLLKSGSLSSAVEYYNANFKPVKVDKTLEEAYPVFLKEKDSLRDASFREYGYDLKMLVDAHPKVKCNETSPDFLKTFLVSDSPITGHPHIHRPWSLSRQLYLLKVIKSFFSWAEDTGYCASNPARKVKLKKLRRDQHEPAILDLGDAQRLLDVAWTYDGGRCAAYMVLATWGAIRPEEVRNLDETKIDLDESRAIVTGGASKLRSRRVVKLAPNLVLMLKDLKARGLLKKENLNITDRDWALIRLFAGLKPASGYIHAWCFRPVSEREVGKSVNFEVPCSRENLKPWVKDVLRHTGISYHLGLFEHENVTATWAGNSPHIIHKHYKGLVTQANIVLFWEMLPQLLRANGVNASPPTKEQMGTHQ